LFAILTPFVCLFVCSFEVECEVEWLLCTHLHVPIRQADRIPRAHSGPITYHWTHFELMMDECMDRFVGPNASQINHPILLTEPVAVPHYTRTRMTELWFEAYRVPSICFGIDALYSFYYHTYHHRPLNKDDTQRPQSSLMMLGPDTLLVSASHSATHLLPIVNGEWLPHFSLRLDVGGAHCTDYLQRLLHLKYPMHRALLQRDLVQHLKHLLCYTAPSNYIDELTHYEVHTSAPPVLTEIVPDSTPLLLQLSTAASASASSSSFPSVRISYHPLTYNISSLVVFFIMASYFFYFAESQRMNSRLLTNTLSY
jgi:hypothetical protein